jgi:hypothetical protein
MGSCLFKTLCSGLMLSVCLIAGQAQAVNYAGLTSYTMVKDTVMAYYDSTEVVDGCFSFMATASKPTDYTANQQAIEDLIFIGRHYPNDGVKDSANRLICKFNLTHYEDTLIAEVKSHKDNTANDWYPHTLDCVAGKSAADYYISELQSYNFAIFEQVIINRINRLVDKDSTYAVMFYPYVKVYDDTLNKYCNAKCPVRRAEDHICEPIDTYRLYVDWLKQTLANKMGTTGIIESNVYGVTNHQNSIKTNGQVYNLSGQILDENSKGPDIRIVNGKLMIVPEGGK